MKDLKLHFFVHLILVQIYCHTEKADSDPPLGCEGEGENTNTHGYTLTNSLFFYL
jgi:hypothetical protein